jgi:transposase
MGRKKKMKLEIVNPNAAGIDVGSRSHFVSIGQNLEEVKEFGVYDEDLKKLSAWLVENNIDTVALESTGDYWQNLHGQLLEDGIEVVLVNGKFTKNIKGKKTDVLDCMWIQKLHALGLLSGSFLPDDITMQLRTYCRQRLNMLRWAAQASSKMQKYLKFLNFRLDVVVSDVCGLTGLKIITAICDGNLSPKELAALRHYNCRKSEEEIEKALHGNNRKEYLFGLKQEFESYQFFKQKIKECEEEIKLFLESYFLSQEFPIDDMPSKNPYKRLNKNAPKNIDLNVASYQYFGGVDLMAIEGVSHATLLTLMSEIGPDGINKFSTAKQFASWLRLAPNNKISGGKTLSRKTPRGSGRLKIALRNAANAIGNLREGQLANFFKRIAYKKGRQIAITATARKLAIVIWNMVTNKEEYKPTESHMFLDEKRKLGIVKRMKKKIASLGITNEDLGLST